MKKVRRFIVKNFVGNRTSKIFGRYFTRLRSARMIVPVFFSVFLFNIICNVESINKMVNSIFLIYLLTFIGVFVYIFAYPAEYDELDSEQKEEYNFKNNVR